ncbi:PAS domain-containing protein [Azospirillum sp. RWY-5-1]|uniref:histidine kinase n=1 Tax=Azospirillum oleiclasticum TaxID=2735135 RepID=A0ABX2T2W4_9PROT|nr:PAS domain-containing sensor histidine kinase [Azospirillum oleiclasticum]NYZ11241.1 PAS domain-containing protein [Azospirillum oleiclasticum]NYZ18402.1 PAS domain-containing protein [Azospirillum oleiclasticum]
MDIVTDGNCVAPTADVDEELTNPAIFADIVEWSPVATAVVEGADHRLVFANRAFRALAPGHQPLHRGDALAGLQNVGLPGVGWLDEVHRTGEPRRHRHVSGARDGFRVWSVECRPVTDREGRVTAIVITADDVTGKEEGRKALLDTLAEKDALLREVNHRAKNSLQLVSSLLTLQGMTAADADLRRKFQDACARIATVAQVHHRLYQTGQYHQVAFGSYLHDLAADLARSLAPGNGGCTVRVEATEATLPTDHVIPLALVVNELVSNAMKHAYGPGGAGDVLVCFEPLPGGGHRLTVADDGRGLPEGFQLGRGDTLGMKMVRALSAQVKARLTVAPNAPGTRFVIDIPA